MQAGYHTGVCRTAVVGERPGQEAPDLADLDRVSRPRAGADPSPAPAPPRSTRSSARRLRGGFPDHFVGHGIGVFLHEDPYIGRYRDFASSGRHGARGGAAGLSQGMGMQNKDVVVVTPNGCELLSNVTPAEELIRVSP